MDWLLSNKKYIGMGLTEVILSIAFFEVQDNSVAIIPWALL